MAVVIVVMIMIMMLMLMLMEVLIVVIMMTVMMITGCNIAIPLVTNNPALNKLYIDNPIIYINLSINLHYSINSYTTNALLINALTSLLLKNFLIMLNLVRPRH